MCQNATLCGNGLKHLPLKKRASAFQDFYHLPQSFPFTTHSRLLTNLGKKPFENMVGKGEHAGNQCSLLFPQCFLTFPKQNV